MAGVIGASLMPGKAMSLANHVLGSGWNSGTRFRPGCALLNRPISHADAVDTKTPSADPAYLMRSMTAAGSGSAFTSQMTAQVSSNSDADAVGWLIGAIC